jgi:AraC-like DNA-binding protein
VTQKKSEEGRMTLAVVGVVAGEPLRVRLVRPSLITPLEAGTADVAIGGESFVVDRTACLVAPKRATIVLSATKPATRVAVLGFGDALVTTTARTYAKLGLDRDRLERWLTRTELLTRTVWVHEIVHRYVFERHALGAHDNLATRFLEIEILKEIYFLFRDREAGADRASASQRYSGTVERAVAFIEAHLFETHGLRELAKRAGASESTLLRAFRRELGCRPGEYWRTRRLDEALALVRGGRYSVAEVAARAGYENPSSFAYAFRARFGKPPSAFTPRRPTRRAP